MRNSKLIYCPKIYAFRNTKSSVMDVCNSSTVIGSLLPVAPVAQRYHVTSDTLGREFDPGKRDFSH